MPAHVYLRYIFWPNFKIINDFSNVRKQRPHQRARDGPPPDHRRPDRVLRRHPAGDRLEAVCPVVRRRRGLQAPGETILHL